MDKYTLYTTTEECGEVTQELMKVLRFGLDQTNPDTGISNKFNLEKEIGQLQYCLHKTIRELGLNNVAIQDSYDKKMTTWAKWKAYYDR